MNLIKSTTLASLIFLLLNITGCGGGGGGSDSFAGVYDVPLRLQEDGCGFGDTLAGSFVHNVNQDGDNIALQSGELSFGGEVLEDRESFVTSNSFAVAGCIVDGAIAYVGAPSSNQFGVGFVADFTCSNVTCRQVLGGLATRR